MVALLNHPSRFRQDAIAERRVFPRTASDASIEIRRIDHTINARQAPRLRADVRDVSVGGLSALSDNPLSAGEHLIVSFPDRPMKLGWTAFGRVIRCEPSAMGYRLAVEFDPLPAA